MEKHMVINRTGAVPANPAENTRLNRAIDAIVEHERKIEKALADGCGSTAFSDTEMRGIIRDCCDFMLAVARSTPDELRAAREVLETLRDQTLETDHLIAGHTRENPRVIGGIISCETALFDMMLTNPEATIVFAGFGERFLTVVQSVLFAGFTDLRHQLEADEGKLVGHLARLAGSLGESLKHPLRVTIGAKIVDAGKKLFAKYGTEIREDVVREMRATKKDLTKAYRQSADSVVGIDGPRNPAKCKQIRDVVIYLVKSRRAMSLYAACEKTFSIVDGGYKSIGALYSWCHDNEEKIWRYVDEMRLS